MGIMQSTLPAIVVVGYNRPKSLQTILGSIGKADFRGYSGVPLTISLDKGDCQETLQIAEQFKWEHGPKTLIVRKERLGLRNHILQCGDLTRDYGSVILLEDDLYVSPVFFDYAVKAMEFFGKDQRICGVSLYSYDLNEFASARFCPLQDGYDNYFMQIASSWGQMWNLAQWESFRKWYDANCHKGVETEERLPQKVIRWKESSWKKYFTKYMVLEDKYFVFPRVAHSTNLGEKGTHNPTEVSNVRVPVALNSKQYSFRSFQDSNCKYDVFHELKSSCIKNLAPSIQVLDFELDLYGIKELAKVQAEHLISIRDCSAPISSWGFKQMPHEVNIILNQQGDFFRLGKVGDFKDTASGRRNAHLKALHNDFGWRIYLKLFVDGFMQAILGKFQKLAKGDFG